MTESPSFADERIDDIPLLLAQMDRMGITALLDEHFPAHGNWQGLSLGQIVAVWLSFILSESNHRLSHLQPWAEQRLRMLRAIVGDELRALDFTDDRLGSILDHLADDGRWALFEIGLGQRTIRVYDLAPERVRIDSTTASGFRDVAEDGIFQFGFSKDHRPDLPQLKINVSTLDPLGMPLTTTVVSGERADEPLYLPEIERVREVVGRRGLTYIGDAKMSAVATRAAIAGGGDYYLCPLPATEMTKARLDAMLDDLEAGRHTLSNVTRRDEQLGEVEILAEGFEVRANLSAPFGSSNTHWSERRLVVRSVALARRDRKEFDEHVRKAVAAIEELDAWRRGKKMLRDEGQTRERVERVLQRYGIGEVVGFEIRTERIEREVRGWGRHPSRVEVDERVRIDVRVDEQARERARRRLGWRAYATNAWPERVGLEEAVLAYRAAYRIEHGFARLKGKPLALSPIYLESDGRVRGLIRVLTIGLRVLTLVEFVARRTLAADGAKLGGLYPANPKRSTATPTTEMLLRAFKAITLIVMTQGPTRLVHIAPLSPLQQRILHLLGLPETLYEALGHRISVTLPQMGGP
jgi:transposase